MPLYEYRCPRCVVLVEAFAPVGQAERQAPSCPGCNRPMRRQPSLPAIHWRCPRPGLPTPEDIMRGEDPYAGQQERSVPEVTLDQARPYP